MENKLKINVDKLKSITFSRLASSINDTYTLKHHHIIRVNQIKSLVDSQLTFIYHVQYLCEYCFKMLGFIFRNTKNFTNVDALCALYYALVRSKLELCSIIGNPYYNVYISSLENIQRAFCKRLYYIKCGAYPARSSNGPIA